MIRRPPRSTQSRSSAASDVYKRQEEYAALLSGFAIFFVGVFAPLEVLEARERQRGDRLIGLARWQYDRIHRGKKYDLEVDSGSLGPPK